LTITYPTLEHVAMEARPYPSHLLEGCETGLVLFAAAFLGHNDAIHFAEAGLRTTCIDNDGTRLREMRALYPSEWNFFNYDAWEYARECSYDEVEWDAVSADTFTGSATRRSLDSLELWCSLARKLVTVTYTAGEAYEVPDGWKGELFERATNVYWLVLTR
jgi:hypothetical protein